MDRLAITARLKEFGGKYKFVLLILLVGIIFMSLPEAGDRQKPEESIITEDVPANHAQELEEILSQIAGVGKVKVLLTEAAGAETVYQTDTDHSTSSDSDSLRIETVIISDSGRAESGLVRTVTPPKYLGAIIVCQGGDQPVLKLSIVEAVSNATGISSDRITVLKMK